MDDLRVFADAQTLAEAAADLIVDRARCAIEKRGWFHFALAGGSTPEPLYRLLTQPPYRSRIDWSRVHIFWGDERCVPPDHVKSNYRMAQESLLAHVPIPNEQIHRIMGELPPGDAAAAYRVTLRTVLGPDLGLDLILLGMGTDGHTASLFPGSSAMNIQDETAVAVHAPGQEIPWRVTLTLPTLNRARAVLFLVTGGDKADTLARVQAGDTLPAGRVQPDAGAVMWLVDRMASESLTP
jgi:6-phosphogluconolactonase